ncbi:MAG TPA: DUF367 family protein [Candidatus Nitrosotalea sp.]|nr:DUF367 family protein [Candidatus Nitrosotalea sp.]
MKVQVFMLKQDDPAKCTAAKLIKFGLATQVRKTIHATVVLHPFAEKTVLKKDKDLVDSITAVDCSWELAQKVFARNFLGFSRKLPPLLAGNPVNYAKIGKLTTAESIAATLFIMGLDDQAQEILNKFKWGHTFFELNQDLLKDYSSAETEENISEISHDYGIMPVF